MKVGILEEEVLVNVSNSSSKYYEQLGYCIPKVTKYNRTNIKKGTEILVKVTDLPKKSKVIITKICDNCGIELKAHYFAVIKQRKNNNGLDICKTCSIRARQVEKAKQNNLELKLPRLAKEFVEVLHDDYKNYTPEMMNITSNLKVLWRCSVDKCHYEWEAKVSDRTAKGSNCPSCHGRVVSNKNRLSLLFPELSVDWHPTKNVSLLPSDVTYASHKMVWWKCSENHEWSTPVHSRTIMNTGCPICSESKGEKRIREWLECNNIKFEHQKTFDNLLGIGGNLLSYDFYLPDFSLLIEYQGQFHDGNGNDYMKLNLPKQKEHDARKKKYAIRQNINLLEIWYWDYDNVEDILTNQILGRD